ncbi:MAG: hypothetical protein COB88_07935 [Flavobacteriales bacterium]|nr:MAG: hypothetical protein COB88_07935 [Flavobacteriales bacterium]
MTSNGQKTKLLKERFNLRSITREKSFEEAIGFLANNYGRLYELDHMIDWAFENVEEQFFDSEELFYKVDDQGHRLWTMAKTHIAPALRILFHYEPETKTVNLIAVDVIPDEEFLSE